MIKLIDFHCHVLPGVDDGSDSEETTRELLAAAYDDGIRIMFTTPHAHPKRGHGGPAQWREALLAARACMDPETPVVLYPGCEILYHDSILESLEKKELWTMGASRYILVEFRTGETFEYIRNGLQKLRLGGYLPILAHVERYDSIDSEDKAEELVEQGIYLQMNADTVLLGKKLLRGKLVRELLKAELIHFIGTDAHDLTERPPYMRDAYRYIQKLCGPDYADAVCALNARKVIKGELIDG